jgi:O-antigen/teichoic acid export membrane protein
MSFRQQAFQNYLWRGMYFFVVFLMNVFVARCYEASASGWINFITNNYALAITFGSFSLEVAVLYYGVKKSISPEKLTTFSIFWVIITSIIFYFTAHLFVSKSVFVRSKSLLEFTSIIYFTGIMLVNFFSNLFLAKKQFFIPYFLLTLVNLITILCIPTVDLFGLQLDKNEFLYFYFASFMIQGLVLAIAYLLYDKFIMPKWITLKEFSKMMQYASIAFVSNISYFLLVKVDYWFLRIFNKDLKAFGNYTYASRIMQMFLIVAMIAASSFFINTADPQSEKRGKELFVKLSRILLLFYTSVIVIFGLFGSQIFVAVYGETFKFMYRPFLAFMPGMLCLFMLTLLGAFYGATNKIIINIISNVLGIVIIAILNLLIMPKYNSIVMEGVICSIGYAAALAFAMWQFSQIQQFNWLEIFKFKKSDFDWVKKLAQPSKY